MSLELACIVEGHGDAIAVPLLVRRIAAEFDPGLVVRVPPPLRVPRSKLVKAGEIERSVEFAARKTAGRGAVLVLVDAEDECPGRLGPDLLRRARATRGDIPVGVVLANREFEAWFLAAAESLRGKRRLPATLIAPANPEAIRDAKGWLSDHMTGSSKYREVLDQPALTAIFDLGAARGANSFAKCTREITRLLAELQQLQAPTT